MRIAILGAAGFLGRNLTKELVSRGHQITGYVVKPPEVQTLGVTYVSISNFDNPNLLRDTSYDAVINLAARRSTRDYPLSEAEVRKFTFEIPKQFILHTASPGTLVINSSTYIQNFEGIEGRTVDSYGAAKQELSEFLSRDSGAFGFNTLDLYFFTLYGEGDRPGHLVPLLLNAVKEGKEISLSPGLQLMNLIYISDAIQNISDCLLLETGVPYRKYHVWDDNYFSVRGLVSTIEEVTGMLMNCNWGAREYAGHEMLETWPIPMPKLPGFKTNVTLDEGLQTLWSQILKT